MGFLNHFIEATEPGRATIHAFPVAYRHASGALRRTVEAFAGGRDGFGWSAVEGVHELDIARDGTRRMRHLGCEMHSRLVGVAAIQKDGKISKVYDANLRDWDCRPEGNRIVWTSPTQGIRYEASYIADGALGGVCIPTSALPWLRKWLPGGAAGIGVLFDWQDGGEGWTVPGDVDTAAGLSWGKGRAKHTMRPFAVELGERTVELRRIRNRGGKYLVEALPLDVLDAGVDIALADSVTYQQGASGYSGCTDTAIDGAIPDNSGDSTTFLGVGSGATGFRYNALLAFDVGLSGVTVTDAQIDLYAYDAIIPTLTINAYRVFKPWVEASATWNKWDGTKAWTTAGGASADDAGSENTGDGTGADRVSTATITQPNLSGTGWKTFGAGQSSFTTLVQAWVDGTATDTRGLLFRNMTGGNLYRQFYRPSEYTTDTTKRPKLAITYTPAATFIPYPRPRGMIGGFGGGFQ